MIFVVLGWEQVPEKILAAFRGPCCATWGGFWRSCGFLAPSREILRGSWRVWGGPGRVRRPPTMRFMRGSLLVSIWGQSRGRPGSILERTEGVLGALRGIPGAFGAALGWVQTSPTPSIVNLIIFWVGAQLQIDAEPSQSNN